jgi:uncharacterized membrane protein
MDVAAVPLAPAWVAAGWAAAIPLVVWALRRAPWRRFVDGSTVHVWFGGIVALVALWSLRASVDGFTFHLVGAAALTLFVGVPLALAGIGVVVASSLFLHGGSWANAALVWLTLGAVPVAVAWASLRWVETKLPPNFFVYVFVAAFFGAWLALGAAGIASLALLALAAGRSASIVYGDYAPYLIFLGFGEAMLSGMALTLAIVYRPQWVATFDDARYIRGR